MAKKIGDVYIDAELRETIGAELGKVDAEITSAMRRFDAMSAEPTIDLTTEDFDVKIKRCKLLIRNLEGAKATATADADIKQLEEKIAKAKLMVKRLDGQKAAIEVELHDAKAKAAMVGLKAEAKTLGRTKIHMGVDVDRGGLGGKALRGLAGAAGILEKAGQNAADAMGQIGVIAGPFASSFQNAGRAFVTVGPLIVTVLTNIAAVASALIGVLGAGIAGAAVLGVGALGAFGVGIAAVAGAITPLIKDLGTASTAQDAYNKAVLEHGKNSDQAAKKLEVLRNVFKGVGKENREAISNWHDLGTEWGKLTKSVRPEFFNLVGESIRTVKDIMPTLADASKTSFHAAAEAAKPLLAAMRSDEFQGAIGTFADSFSRMVGPITNAIGLIIGALGRIGEAALPHVENVVNAIEDWAQGFFDATGNTKELQSTVDSLVGSFNSVVGVIEAAGNLALAFFSQGADEGKSMIDSLSDSMNEAADWLNKNPDALENFFEDGKQFAEDAAGAIADVTGALVQIASIVNGAMTPIRALADAWDWVSGAIDDTLGKIPGWVPVIGFMADAWRGPIEAIGNFIGVVEDIGSAIGDLATMIYGTLSGIEIPDFIGGPILAMVNVALGALSSLTSALGSVLDGVGIDNPFGEITDWINNLRDDLSGKPVKVTVSAETQTASTELDAFAGVVAQLPIDAKTKVALIGAIQAGADILDLIGNINGLPPSKNTKVQSNATAAAGWFGALAGAVRTVPGTKRVTTGTNAPATTGLFTVLANAVRGVPGSKRTSTSTNAGATTGLMNILRSAIYGIPTSHGTTISQSGGESVASTARDIANAIASVPGSKHVTFSSSGSVNPKGRAQGGSFATGGQNTIALARDTAARKPTRRTSAGAQINSPTMLVGEENRTEYVIATNPSYRKNNIKYWMKAGKDLGVPGFAYGGGTGPMKNGKVLPGGYTAKMDFYEPPKGKLNYGKHSNIKGLGKLGENTKKRKYLTTANSPWLSLVEKLQVQEGQLATEIGLRQREVKEPASFVKETGQLDKNGDPTYEIDQAAIDAYKATLAPVQAAQDTLVKVLAQEIDAIPKALSEVGKRKKNAIHNVDVLEKARNKYQRRLTAEQNKKEPSSRKVNYFQDQIRKLDKGISDQNKVRSDSAADAEELTKRFPEAGFDYRDAGLDAKETADEIASVSPGATQEAADKNAPGLKESTGSGSTSDPNVDAQTAQDAAIGAVFRKTGQVAQAFHDTINGPGDIGTGIGTALGAVLGGTAGLSSAVGRGMAQGVAETFVGGSASGSGQVAAAYAAGPSGSGGTSAVPGGGDGGGVTINVQTLHPGDPRTLRAIGDAATSGMAYQGAGPSSRTAI